MIGVALCGGQSTRMGADKGLLMQNDLTWVDTAVFQIIVIANSGCSICKQKPGGYLCKEDFGKPVDC